MSLPNIPKPDHISAQTWKARTLLNEGRDFFVGGNLEQAVACFREAKRLASNDPTDPTKNTARLYLGVTYKSRHNPEAPENGRWLDYAKAEFTEVFSSDPRDTEMAYAAAHLLEIMDLRTLKRAVEN